MLSTVITTDGLHRNVEPSNGTDFSLEELKEFVGGYIEIVYLSKSQVMVVNEEGKLIGLEHFWYRFQDTETLSLVMFWFVTQVRSNRMDKTELMSYLVDEAEYSENEVAEMTNTELLDKWLEYNGICGFTEDIMKIVEVAFDVDLED